VVLPDSDMASAVAASFRRVDHGACLASAGREGGAVRSRLGGSVVGWTSKAVAAATVVGVLVAGAAPPAVAGESWQQQVGDGQAEEPGETAVELKQRTVDRLVLALEYEAPRVSYRVGSHGLCR